MVEFQKLNLGLWHSHTGSDQETVGTKTYQTRQISVHDNRPFVRKTVNVAQPDLQKLPKPQGTVIYPTLIPHM